MGCGKILGGASGYTMRCGGLWCGSIAQCDDCEKREIELHILRKQKALLDKQLKNKESIWVKFLRKLF